MASRALNATVKTSQSTADTDTCGGTYARTARKRSTTRREPRLVGVICDHVIHYVVECDMDTKPSYRFPDKAWWDARSEGRPISQDRIDRLYHHAKECGTTVSSIVPWIVRRIVEQFDPIAVWLFGSIARGNVHKHSDVDIMVIMPDGTERLATAVAMRGAVVKSLLPKDILVETLDCWDGKKDIIGSIQREVRTTGVMLYG